MYPIGSKIYPRLASKCKNPAGFYGCPYTVNFPYRYVVKLTQTRNPCISTLHRIRVLQSDLNSRETTRSPIKVLRDVVIKQSLSLSQPPTQFCELKYQILPNKFSKHWDKQIIFFMFLAISVRKSLIFD